MKEQEFLEIDIFNTTRTTLNCSPLIFSSSLVIYAQKKVEDSFSKIDLI